MSDPNEAMSNVVRSFSSLIKDSAASPRRFCALMAILLAAVAYFWITKKQTGDFTPKTTATAHNEANAANALAAPVSKSQADVVNVQVSPTFSVAPPAAENRAQIAGVEQERYYARLDKMLDQAFSLPSPRPPPPRSQTEIDRAQAGGELIAAENEMQRYDATSETFEAKAARERYLSAWKRLGLKSIPYLPGVAPDP
jgi:hypothetical protein